ncbi:hypothetical protein VTI28DRAFT_10109 [Corynascus sepedonium]
MDQADNRSSVGTAELSNGVPTGQAGHRRNKCLPISAQTGNTFILPWLPGRQKRLQVRLNDKMLLKMNTKTERTPERVMSLGRPWPLTPSIEASNARVENGEADEQIRPKKIVRSLGFVRRCVRSRSCKAVSANPNPRFVNPMSHDPWLPQVLPPSPKSH